MHFKFIFIRFISLTGCKMQLMFALDNDNVLFVLLLHLRCTQFLYRGNGDREASTKVPGGVGRKVHLIYFTQFWWECQWKIWAEFKRVVPSHYAKWRCSNESKCHLICLAINSYRIPELQWWIFQFGFYMRALLEYIMKNKVENSSNLWCKNSCALC